MTVPRTFCYYLRYPSRSKSRFLALTKLVSFLLVTGTCSFVHADGFDIFSKHEELKNHAIIDAGDFEKIDTSDGRLGRSEILILNSNCFRLVGLLSLWSYGKKSGFLLADQNKSFRVALLESNIGAIKVESASVVSVPCPTRDGSGLPIDLQQRIEELKRRHELSKQQLERLRQQQK